MKTKLLAPFGIEGDIDLTQPPSQACAGELNRLLDEHGLLVFRGRPLDGEQQMRLTACFGRVARDEDGRPLEMRVSNRQRSSAPTGELIFHYDYAYDAEPIDVISLYGEEIGEGATPTLFASSTRAADRLAPQCRSQISKYQALHACFMDRLAPAAERAAMQNDGIRRGEPGWSAADWRATHNLLWENRRGKPSLFACLQHTVRVLDLPIDESDALLDSLFSVLYSPDNVYEHRWHSNDLVIWDNRAVQHCRPAPNDVPRTLRRYEVCRLDLTAKYLAIGRAEKFV
jgi:taurine dioxygenase